MDAAMAATVDEASRRFARGLEEVRGAILLASRGTFSVLIANLPDARRLGAELEDEATRNDVELLVEDGGDGHADLRIRHR